MEHGVYRALLRLGFEMDISLIQVLAITQKHIQSIKLFFRCRAINQKTLLINERYIVLR